MKQHILKTSLALLCGCVLILSFCSQASAHVISENNGISAVLHIPPDDNPVAAQSTTLDFSFNSERGNFSLKDCDCQLKVQSNGRVLQTVGLKHSLDGGALDASATVNFPTIGVYDVILTGNSNDRKFQSFTLNYLERVANTAQSTKSTVRNGGATIVLISGTSFVLLAMVAFKVIHEGGRYRSRQLEAKTTIPPASRKKNKSTAKK